MEKLLSDSELRELTEEYHLLDGSEAPLLIKLLWDIRHFQEDLLALPIHRLELLLPQVWELDQAIATQILQIHNAMSDLGQIQQRHPISYS